LVLVIAERRGIAMGYKPSKKYYSLEFPEYPGLEITVKGTTVGKIIDVSDMSLDLTSTTREEKTKLFRLFAKKITSWNVDHPEPEEVTEKGGACAGCGLEEGQPLPTTPEAMECLDVDFILPIIFGWFRQQATVSPGKGQSSNDGDRITKEAMRQLDALQSQSKLPVPNFS
jgi:hypothetical protein